MNLEDIRKIPNKEKKRLIKEVCLMYRRINDEHKILDPMTVRISDSKKIRSLSNAKTISMFKTILELLPSKYNQIIKKDFIEYAHPYWYTEFYSKTTYYKLKAEAMNSFLYLFYR